MDVRPPPPQCPKCAEPKARWLEQVLTNRVNTFRSEMCGHIWTTRALTLHLDTEAQPDTSRCRRCHLVTCRR